MTEETGHVLGVHRTAVEDTDLVGSILVVEIGNHRADVGTDFFGLLIACGYTGSDRPDRLVSNRHEVELLGGDTSEAFYNLLLDEVEGDTGLTLLEGLAAAEDRTHAPVQERLGLLVDGFVCIGKVLSALTMTDDGIGDLEIREHLRGDLACVRTLVFPVCVLSGDLDVGEFGCGDGCIEDRERNTDHNLRVRIGHERLQLV